METGHQAPNQQENPDQLASNKNTNNNNDPDHHEQGGGAAVAGGQAARSYECTFCKRGFSNAQALGGHMNIHRKDKAKLNKHMTSNIETPPPPPVAAIKHPTTSLIMEAKSSEHDKSSINWPINVLDKSNKDDKTHVDQEIRKLQFLVQKSLNNREESFLSISELDLELRLGPDPDHQDYSSTGTKKFS